MVLGYSRSPTRMQLSPYLLNLLLEVMMSVALKTVDTGISLNGQVVNNLRFADDIDLIAESPEEL